MDQVKVLCPVCLDSYAESLTRTLNCGHSLCDGCYVEVLKHGQQRLQLGTQYFLCPYRCEQSELTDTDTDTHPETRNACTTAKCSQFTKRFCLVCSCLASLSSVLFVFGHLMSTPGPPE